MSKFFFKLLVGVVMWVVRIAGLRLAIRTTHITTPTSASTEGASSQTTLALHVSYT